MKKTHSNHITFETRENEYVAVNGKIEDFGLSVLEDDYSHHGFVFENDDYNNEAIMYWPEGTQSYVVADAKAAFENYIVHWTF